MHRRAAVSLLCLWLPVYDALQSMPAVMSGRQHAARSALVRPMMMSEATVAEESAETVDPCTDCDVADMATGSARPATPFSKIMAANRAEIAVRIMRAATELNLPTVAIYGYEDRYSQHRWGADQSFLLEKTEEMSPVQAYLDIPQVIAIAKENGVDAIHPGYGFLSESPEFAQARSAS